jgi:hypothetical protein
MSASTNKVFFNGVFINPISLKNAKNFKGKFSDLSEKDRKLIKDLVLNKKMFLINGVPVIPNQKINNIDGNKFVD